MWVSEGGNPETSISGFSNGEREIANMIIQLARRRLLTEQKGLNYSFILVDEAADNLDAYNMERLVIFLRKSNMQALVVTHGMMRDAFPDAVAVPVHLQDGERFSALFTKVQLRNDGEWWEV